MTEHLFGYGGDLPPLDEGPDEEDDDTYYDNVNDDTFGAGAEAGDWENTHEKMAGEFDFAVEPRKGLHDVRHDDLIPFFEEEDLEKSISKLVLDEDDTEYDPAASKGSMSKPISIKKGIGESNISQLFGPQSPPSLFDPSLMSPKQHNIWGSPEVRDTIEMPHRQLHQQGPGDAEERLKAMLNIGRGGAQGRGGEENWEDPAIVRAVSNTLPPQPAKKKVMSLAELEQELTGRKSPTATASSATRALPARSISPEIGSPTGPVPLPIGTPPQGLSHMQHAARLPHHPQLPHHLPPTQHIQQASTPLPATPPQPQKTPGAQQSPIVPIHPQLLQQLTRQVHQSIGGRVSPTQISQLIIRLHSMGGRISPNTIRHAVFTSIPPPSRESAAQRSQQISGSPGFGASPRAFHAGSPQMPSPYSSSPRGPVAMGTSPGANMSPMQMGGGRGMRGGFPRAMHGLTPMNPRIPPVHSRPRFSGPRGAYSNMGKYDRAEGPRAQRQIRFPRGGGGDHRRFRGDFDEYGCLMSQKEKEWVIKIQMLQLTSNNPAVDDFYFQNYMQRKAAKEKDREERGKGGTDEGKDRRKEKKLLLRPLENRAYQPAQFEGALGKLTSSSVNNPRQIIDIHIENAPEDEEGGKPSAKDHGRRRRTLLAIERLYSMVLVIEDLNIQVGTLPESDTGPLLEKKRGLVQTMCATLKGEKGDNLTDRTPNSQLHQMLGIRKGRKLLARLIPLLAKEDAFPMLRGCHANLMHVFRQEAKDLKKDAIESQKGHIEETLPLLYPPLSNVIHETDLDDLTLLVDDLEAQVATTPSAAQLKGSSVISNAVQNKFGVSLVLCMINHAEEIYLSHDVQPKHRQWEECIHLFAQAICVVSDVSIARPLGKFPLVLDHFSRFVSKQPLNALEKRLRTLIDHEE